MAYAVKEIYFTFQGEGVQTGRPAVFLRFAGCNLWTGREEDRSGAVCSFCDTDFVGTDGPRGGKYVTARKLAESVRAVWDSGSGGVASAGTRASADALVVATGGEPLLQLDSELVERLHELGLEVAVETNGTIAAPAGIDWLCVSPKAGANLAIRSGHELKLVYPQSGAQPNDFEELDFRHFSLQPMDGPNVIANTRAAIAYSRVHPKWRVSLQAHKLAGLP